MKSSPPKLEDAIENLQKNGYLASCTSFCPTGFRTNANINEIVKVLSDQPVNPKHT
jgi:tRNA (guanine26-N2/guanine27-N2)-dimethyltransferase